MLDIPHSMLEILRQEYMAQNNPKYLLKRDTSMKYNFHPKPDERELVVRVKFNRAIGKLTMLNEVEYNHNTQLTLEILKICK